MNRSKQLQAKTPLSRGTPLKATAGLKRRKPMGRGTVSAPKPRARRGSMSAAVALVLAGEATVAQAARQCEVDADRLAKRAWTVVKGVVMERDNWTCAAGPERAVDVHHRQPKGMGGSADPVIAFGAVNLIGLCREHHDLCHAEDPEMGRRGFMLKPEQDPAETPVYVRSEWGCERFWLLPGGGLSRTGPGKAEAA